MDIKRMMSQMQNQYSNIQKKMDTLLVESSVGGEEGVFIQMNGKFEVKNFKINFLPKDRDDIEILEDMIKKALLSCHTQIESEIKKTTGGMF
jgi:DNA-binding protein YbaB